MKQKIFSLLIVAILALAGCSPTATTQEIPTQETIVVEKPKLNVITTLFPLYEFAKQVGGDKVEVTLLLPPGVEPHSFEPKPSDIIKLENADSFIYIGEIMEPWAHDILEGLSNKDLHVLDASSLVTLLESGHHDEHEDDHNEHGHDADHEEHSDEHSEHEEHHEAEEHHEEHGDEHDEHEEHHEAEEHHDEHGDEHEEHEDESEHDHHDHGAFDPHIWLDLENDQTIVSDIARVFSSLDGENSDYYVANADAYAAKLQALDVRYTTELASCSQDEFLVGGHNFFGYIEQRYQISGISAIENLAPNTEPTPKRIQEITEVANEHGIKYILTEVLVSTQMAEAIASESGAEVLTFHPGANLPKADLDNGATFLTVMEKNLDTLKTALECN